MKTRSFEILGGKGMAMYLAFVLILATTVVPHVVASFSCQIACTLVSFTAGGEGRTRAETQWHVHGLLAMVCILLVNDLVGWLLANVVTLGQNLHGMPPNM